MQDAVDTEGHQRGDGGRAGGGQDSAYGGGVQQTAARGAQRAPQQQVAQYRACDEAESVGRTEVAGDEVGIVGEVRCQ